jgi:sucrose phosphorylase
MHKQDQVLLDHLSFLYGAEQAHPILEKLTAVMDKFAHAYPEIAKRSKTGKLSEKDVILITYGDMVSRQGQPPLETLGNFLQQYLADVVNTVHILPFYPYSSDDGFSVIDYRQVNSAFGTWEDVSALNQNFRLMFDAVINHCSSQSEMFQGFLKGDPAYADFFTVVEPGTDLTRVFRPRATPVVTPYQTSYGEKLVWTTFSADQVDLNFKNPEVLLEVVKILLFYVANGAEFLRFDAVTYVWKELGTNCINLPQTHRVVQLMRSIMEGVAPNVVIITETNVPHKDNIAYFGDGTNEAQMVYNFALPLLTLYSFLSADATILSEWASTLSLPSNQTAFFNFLACHDGIGMLPVKDILPESDLVRIADGVREKGGFVSYKSNEDGSQSPYELNINYLDALSIFDEVAWDENALAKRFLSSQAIMLALRGVPGIYFHSVFGSQNWLEGAKETGRHRTINREKLAVDQLKAALAAPGSLRARVYQGFCQLLRVRQEHPAFHPFGEQEILDIHPGLFALVRTSPNRSEKILCLHNVSGEARDLTVNLAAAGLADVNRFEHLLNGGQIQVDGGILKLSVLPFEVVWLKAG